MEVIKEAECENRSRLFDGCRKPADAKKLDARGKGDGGLSTVTVLDTDGRGAGDIKQPKLVDAGRHFAIFSLTVAKLIGSAEIKQRSSNKELPRPFLKRLLESSREKAIRYLDFMQNVGPRLMLRHDARLT